MHSTSFYLACDLGGTKVLLALYQGDTVYKQARYASQNFSSLETILRDFLSDIQAIKIKRAVFGVAGPVIQRQTANVTNLPWQLSTKTLQQDFLFDECIFINDMEATSLGVLSLPQQDIVPIYEPQEIIHGNIAVIGLGTGVGQTLLVSNDSNYFPAASEGGHRGFAPQNVEQETYWQYLYQFFGHAPSIEQVLCGKGIGLAYDFLSIEHQDKIIFHGTDRNAEITQQALAGHVLANKALSLYFEILASETGNLGLQYNALGGIYLAGGVIPKILPLLNKESFVKSAHYKPPMQAWLEKMPIYAVKNPETALAGARYFCCIGK